MRFAIASGVLAVRGILEMTDYDFLWRRELLPRLQASLVNRALYEHCGNAGYTWLLRAQERVGDARHLVRWLYHPGWVKRLILPWARAHYRSRRRDAACSHADWTCIWCRCGGEYA